MTLDEYIVAYADRGADESFLRQFGSAEVFFSIDAPSNDLKDGPLTASPDVDIKVPLAKLDIGRMALFFASSEDPRLSKRFAGMPLIRAAEMVLALPDVDGMLIQSRGEAWFVAGKKALRKGVGHVRA
jgi:hypothetical protein